MKRRDDGAATILALATCAVLAVLGGVLVEAGLAAVTRHRVAAALKKEMARLEHSSLE